MALRIITTEVFEKWFDKLKDIKAIAIINAHIDRMIAGNMGNIKSVGNGICEKKIYYGTGYRLYFYKKNNEWIILLCGGNKSTQQRDIEAAKKMLKELKNNG
ncbi:toxin ParE [Candidatus Termititenax persephonae]|uniref:Toxin ParE n=1 Tax=Candidatus Termititenax persephonae TaxID=2218525 RepID=A0A388TEI7_9BACT|nr:toxin ParE [Candidatus Termititenax persephonae]